MSNNSKNNNGLSFIAGLLVGGAALYYINTPNGRKFVNNLQVKGENLSEYAQEQASIAKSKLVENVNSIKEQASATLESGKATLSKLGSEVKQKIDNVLPENETVKDFKAGVEAAKAKMNDVHLS